MKKLYYIFLSIRPRQSIKNFIIFIPLIFSWYLFNLDKLFYVLIIFLLFSLFVWWTYIINDYLDIENDKRHPIKKNRPIASWEIPRNNALIIWIIFMLFSLISVYFYYNFIIFLLFILYLINSLLYSFVIKNIVVVDVFSIAFGFVLRWLIWIYVIWVFVSEWFLLIIFFWALLLWFLKRFQELKLNINTRKNIKNYNESFLMQVNMMLTTILLFIYTFYTFNSVQSKLFLLTLPLVVFWIIRYYYNIFFLEKYSEGIENIILADKSIMFSLVLYLLLVLIIIY